MRFNNEVYNITCTFYLLLVFALSLMIKTPSCLKSCV